MIYCWIGIISCIVFCLIGYRVEKKSMINPLSIFSAEWTVILLFSSMQLWTLTLPDNYIYIIIVIGLLFYFIGYILFLNLFKKYNIYLKINNTNFYIHYNLRYKILYLLSISSIIYYLLLTFNVLKQINSYNLLSIISVQRADEFVGYNNKIINALSIFVFRPVSIAVPAITATDFWFGKRNKVLISLCLVQILLNMLSSGGRTNILIFGIYFILCAVVYLRKNFKTFPYLMAVKIKKRNKRILRRVIIVFGVVFIVTTVSRGHIGTEIFQNVYIAFAIQPRMFEIWRDYVIKNHIIGFGNASFFGFVYPFFYFFKNLLGLQMPTLIDDLYHCINLTETQWVWPGTGMYNNAYVSLYWFYYTDARLFGVIVGMLFLGIYSAKRFYNISSPSKFNERNMSLYCLCINLLIFSFVRFQFAVYQFAIAFIYVYFIAYKKSYIKK